MWTTCGRRIADIGYTYNVAATLYSTMVMSYKMSGRAKSFHCN